MLIEPIIALAARFGRAARGSNETGWAVILNARRMRYWSRLPVDDQDIFSLIGEDGFRRLVSAFYRQIPKDDLLGPMYPASDLTGAEERLRGFLIFRFGGPPRYIEERGHPRLRMRHAPFAIGQAARNRWVELMNNAFAEAALPAEAETALREFFEGTATFMINRPA